MGVRSGLGIGLVVALVIGLGWPGYGAPAAAGSTRSVPALAVLSLAVPLTVADPRVAQHPHGWSSGRATCDGANEHLGDRHADGESRGRRDDDEDDDECDDDLIRSAPAIAPPPVLSPPPPVVVVPPVVVPPVVVPPVTVPPVVVPPVVVTPVVVPPVVVPPVVVPPVTVPPVVVPPVVVPPVVVPPVVVPPVTTYPGPISIAPSLSPTVPAGTPPVTFTPLPGAIIVTRPGMPGTGAVAPTNVFLGFVPGTSIPLFR